MPAVIMMPIHKTIAIPASIGTTEAIAGDSPTSAIAQKNTSFSTE
jgi:hypothetical protein